MMCIFGIDDDNERDAFLATLDNIVALPTTTEVPNR